VLGAGVFSLKTKAVLFDLGNTLVTYEVAHEVIFQRVLDSLGISRPVDEIKEALAKTEQDFADLNYRSLFGKISCEEYWTKWDSLVLGHLDVAKSEELAGDIQARWFDYVNCEACSGAREVLSKLKKMGLKTGLISTAYEEEIAVIFGKANLENGLFDVIVGADTVRKGKPHPDVFKYALKKLNVKPEEAVFVGDSVDADYNGAENVGVKAVLMQKKEDNMKRNSGLRTITGLEEIFKYID